MQLWQAKLAYAVLLMHIVVSLATGTPSVVLGMKTINLSHYARPAGASAANATAVLFYLYTSSRQLQPNKGPKLPALYFLNGFNVAAKYYSDLAKLLAASGFHVAASDYRRAAPFTLPGIAADCPGNTSYVSTSAATLNTLMDAQPPQGAQGAQQLQRYRAHARANGIVLIAHSSGGSVALDLLSGRCDHFNDGASCENYYRMTRGCGSADIVRGVFAWEGYSSIAIGQPAPIVLQADKFAVYMQGEFNLATKAAFANFTTGSKCTHWIKMKGNHYGLANPTGTFFANGTVSQIAPCALPARADPVGFTIAKSLQKKIVSQLANIIIKATPAILRFPNTRQRDVTKVLAASSTVLDSNLTASCFL